MGTGGHDDRLTTREWYDHIAPHYEGIAGAFETPPRREGLRHLGVRPGEVVVDIGCGPGIALVDIARAVGEDGLAIGVDIAPTMCTLAHERLRRTGLDDQAAIVEADGTTLPLEASSVDGVFLSFTLELLPWQLMDRLLDEIATVLTHDGRLVVVALIDRPVTPQQVAYRALHACFPTMLDCRPIPLERTLKDSGYDIQRIHRESMTGIPVGVATATPQAIGRIESNG